MLKLCVVTGTRAEYGLLSGFLKKIKSSPEFKLQLVATGMHLSRLFGFTCKDIEVDGFKIDAKVDINLTSDTPVGITRSMGIGVAGFGKVFSRLKPDIVLVLGDRFEILSAVQAALIWKIPVAHIAGGDSTEGAFDEAVRHSITKMAHLHFVTNKDAALRVRQLGENPKHIYNVGSLGVDLIGSISLLDRKSIEKSIGFSFRRKNILVTFHPVTLEEQPPAEQFSELLGALEILGPDVGLIITYPNADTFGHKLIRMIEKFVSRRGNAKAYRSLGQLRYLSAINQVDAVVGNSSSGLYEVPSFKKPTVNIGDRQKGRLMASSVINCRPNKEEIVRAIRKAFVKDCSKTVNPYGNGATSEKILAILKRIDNPKELVKKHFFNIKV